MTGTRSDFLWTLCGRLGFTGANAVMMLGLYLSDREAFPLERFGTVLVFIQAQLLLSRLLLCGQDQAVVRFWPERGMDAVHDAFFWIRRIATVPMILVILPPLLLPPFGGRGPKLDTFDLAFLVVLGATAQAYLDAAAAVLMAKLRFRPAGLLLSIGPLLRCAAVLLVAARHVELAYTLGTVVIAFFAVRIAHPDQKSRRLLAVDPIPGTGRLAALRYGGWIAVADALVVLSLSAGVFALKFQGPDLAAEASLLAFAMAVAQGHFSVFLAFYQSLLPHAARAASLLEFQTVLDRAHRSARRLALGLVGLTVLGILVLTPMVTEFRPEGLGFEWPLCVLTGFMIVLVLEAPLGVTCQFLKRPRLQVYGLAARATVAVGLAFALAPLGAVLASSGQLAGALAGFCALYLLVRRARHERRDLEARACAASQA